MTRAKVIRERGLVRSDSRAPLWLLALITFSGTMGMHIFVPALPFVAADFAATSGSVQYTVSVYIGGLAIGQLVYGPVSDSLGRRPVLIAGMAVYALAGIGAMLAPSLHALIAARLFQALGGCAGFVLARAIVRDTATGSDTAKELSLLNLMVTVGPGIAPLIGTALASTAGWRAIFVVLSLLGVSNFLLAWKLLRETGGGQRRDLPTVLRSYGRLLRSRRFVGCAIGGGLATTSLYAFITSAPFIFAVQLGRPVREVGFFLAFNIVGVWLGSLTTNRLAGRVAVNRLMVCGNALSCVGAAVFLAAVGTSSLTLASSVLPMFVFTYGAGLASPAALAEALSVDPRAAGSASGLYGFAQMGTGAICTALSGIGSNPALSAGVVLLLAGLLGQLSFWIVQRATPVPRAR